MALIGSVAEGLAEFGGALEIPGEIGLGLGVDFGQPPDSGKGTGDEDDEGGPVSLEERLARHGFYFDEFRMSIVGGLLRFRCLVRPASKRWWWERW